jgi:hypothetical protein
VAERLVYGVHSVKADEIAATEIICRVLGAAEDYASSVSTDPGVLAAAVTSYSLDAPGHRCAIALYVCGQRQEAPYISNDRRINARGRAPNR